MYITFEPVYEVSISTWMVTIRQHNLCNNSKMFSTIVLFFRSVLEIKFAQSSSCFQRRSGQKRNRPTPTYCMFLYMGCDRREGLYNFLIATLRQLMFHFFVNLSILVNSSLLNILTNAIIRH